MNYTPAQLAVYAQNAGFSGQALTNIVAIAMAESNGGDPHAINPNDPYGGSYGILQINGSHIQGLFGNAVSLSCAFDPQCSFNFAYQLSNHGTKFTDWGSYTDGRYRQFLGESIGGSALNPTTGVVKGIVNTPAQSQQAALGNPFDFITQSGLWQWLSDPTRLFKLTTGILLLGLALLLLVMPGAEKAAGTAAKAALL